METQTQPEVRRTIELAGCFKDVKVFFNGAMQEHSERSEGNEIKSIIIETDSNFDLWELKDSKCKKSEQEELNAKKLETVDYKTEDGKLIAIERYSDGSARKVHINSGIVDYILTGEDKKSEQGEKDD